MRLHVVRSIFGRRTLSTIKNWNESLVITDRRSKFQARHVEIKDPIEIPDILSQFLAEHKNIAKKLVPSSHACMENRPGFIRRC